MTTAINNNSSNAGGSRISRGEQGYVIRGIGLVRNLSDLGNIVVTQRKGVPILIRDLGRLTYSHQERQGILGKDNNADTIEGIVDMLKYENASQVLKGIHAKVAELTGKLAPMGVRIVPYIDRDDLVQGTVHKVMHTVLEGVGLVCIVLILFLGSPASALIAATTIPFALASVFILMHFTNMPANLFSLGALDFGIIVDGAIVVTEAVLRKREADPTSPLTRAGRARRDFAGGEADLLCHAHHHHRLPSTLRVRAGRSEALLAHGPHGGLRPSRRARLHLHPDPRPRASWPSGEPKRMLPQPAAGGAHAGV